jgi:hypothetical protein
MFAAAFYKGTRPGLQGIYSRGVRWVECGDYSHCELVFSDGMSASASWIDGGVRFKHIEFNPEHWDFIELPSEWEDDARLWFAEHVGMPYDITGNGRFLCGLVRESQGKVFCSEALAAALGLTEPWRYGPNGLANILRDMMKRRNG